MSAISQSLIFNQNNTSTVAVVYPNTATNTLTYYSEPVKGNGYYNSGNGLHTCMYVTTQDFVGTVTMQATLATSPSEADWFTVVGTTTSYDDILIQTESGVDSHNFEGNFVWVRGSVTIDQGSVLMIQYNH